MKPIVPLLPILAAALTLAACDDGGSTPAAPPNAECGTEATQLSVGQAAWLASQGSSATCLLAGGTEYALAYVDLRSVRLAETQPEAYSGGFPDYTVTIATGGGGAGAARTVLARPATVPGVPESDVRFLAEPATADENAPYNRATPWTEGERFPMYDAFAEADRPARVLRVYDGRVVVAWYEGDSPERVAPLVAALDEAVPRVLSTTLPLLRHAFVDRLPAASTGSGQTLLVLRDGGVANASAWANARPVGDSLSTWIEIKLVTGGSPVALASLLSHEITHSYQQMYMWKTRPAGGLYPGAGAAIWGVEGGADLGAWEAARRIAGTGLLSNSEWRNMYDDSFRRVVAFSAQPGRAFFNDGYSHAMGLLRDQMTRRVQAGEKEDDAVREVLRGAVEGWYGLDRRGAQRAGFTARMRERLGASWTPDEALLSWALSHAADDLTRNPVFQDATFRDVVVKPGEPGWGADGELGATGRLAVTRPYGAPGFVRLAGGSGELRVEGSADVPGVRWMVLRVR
jgi:hypothetical protein